MLRFEVTYKDKRAFQLGNVLTAELDRQLDVPADSLTLTVPYNRTLIENADMLSAYSGDEQVFFGQIDEIVTVKQSGGLISRLSARSLAAALLDNEAEPLEYNNPSSRLIYNRHLAPFGITEYDEERHPLYGNFRISKGMSHWQVIENYCKKRYGAIPRISGSRAYLKGIEAEGEALFGGDGTSYFEMREYRRRCKLISKVRLMFSTVAGYGSYILNENPECEGVERVRFVNALADNTSVDTAQSIIDAGNRDSYFIKLKCVGSKLEILGKAAIVDDNELGRIENLRVYGVNYKLNSGGELTTVVLRKEKF